MFLSHVPMFCVIVESTKLAVSRMARLLLISWQTNICLVDHVSCSFLVWEFFDIIMVSAWHLGLICLICMINQTLISPRIIISKLDIILRYVLVLKRKL